MKIENEEIKISSYGLHEMEESATQISIKGEEEMSKELTNRKRVGVHRRQ